MAEKFFSIEVYYKHDNELRREVLKNITGKKLKDFRETFFTVGLAVHDPTDPKHWIIVSPFHITSIDVWAQDNFFKE